MTIETKTVAEIAAETKAAFDRKFDELKALAEDAKGRAERGEDMGTSLTEKLDAGMLEVNELKAQVSELEQKSVRTASAQTAHLTPGQRLIESEEFKSFASVNRPRGRLLVDVKDISSLTTDAAGSVGSLIDADRSGVVSMIPNRRMTVRSLLAPGSTNSNAIEYDKEVGFTNNASPVAEGAAKPQSELQFEDASAPVRTIAHWMRASVQVLADTPALQSIIDMRLRYGLSLAEEAQLLNGSGTGQNLSGLVTEATAFSAAFTPASATAIDTLRLAALQVTLAEYMGEAFILNPIDWARIELTKDAEGRYIIGQPQGALAPTLWGLPVVATPAMTVDKFLTGAFSMGAQIFDRQNATVELSTEDGDNFQKNKVTIRAEERVALAIYRPEAFVYGDLGFVA